MRYYFDLRDGAPVRDRHGQEFDTPSQAIDHAKSLAEAMRLRAADVRADLHIRVMSDDSQMIHEEFVYADCDGLSKSFKD